MKLKLKKQRGFTLIELVMIIVILGILAATAIVKYVDLQAGAEESACKGIYGNMVSAYGITIASIRNTPSYSQVNTNITGTPGDMTVNGSATNIQYANSTNQTILGNRKRCTFTVDDAADITAIGSLAIANLP